MARSRPAVVSNRLANVRIASIALLTLRGDKRLPGLDILRLLAAAAPFTASAEYKDENVVSGVMSLWPDHGRQWSRIG
jgi:hypothetical protein